MDKNSTYTLNNGYQIPIVGFGTIIPKGVETVDAVKNAIASGYRLIDTATAYDNEESVGQGVREAIDENGFSRDDIFVTTKVWNDHHGYKKTKQSIEDSLERLGLDYLDMYLIHWPANKMWHEDWREINASTWLAMEEYYKKGLIKAIGVSNFDGSQLSSLIVDSEVKPVVNQLEYHPGFAQRKAADYSRDLGVNVEAWRAFGGPGSGVLHDLDIIKIGKKYKKSASQVVIRWLVQKEIIPLAKSTNPDHISDNLDFFDFELNPEDMQIIDGISYRKTTFFDPETYHS